MSASIAAMSTQRPIMVLKSERRRGRRSPVVHVLMPDGRVTEFKQRAIVVPEPGEHESDVWAVLITSDGRPYVTPDGQVAVVKVPALQLAAQADPNEPLTWKQVAKRAGLSLSSVKRAVSEGELGAPGKVGKRAVRFRAADVESWLKGMNARRVVNR